MAGKKKSPDKLCHRHYRAIFERTYGEGPHPCYYCGEPLVYPDLEIHHKDHDKTNCDPTNLTAIHSICHRRHHHLGRVLSEEHRQKLSIASRTYYETHDGPQLGKPHSEETKRKLSESGKKVVKTEEHRRNLSKAATGRKMTGEAKGIMSMSALNRWSDPEQRRLQSERTKMSSAKAWETRRRKAAEKVK